MFSPVLVYCIRLSTHSIVRRIYKIFSENKINTSIFTKSKLAFINQLHLLTPLKRDNLSTYAYRELIINKIFNQESICVQ